MNENKFLQIKKYTGKEAEGDYFYAERLGVDSVAFVLHDRNREDCFGLINEFKPPLNDFLISAFGGSLDKPYGMLDIVKEEVREEAGYKINISDISCAGRSFVSTQMNQFCYLYLVDVTYCPKFDPQPQSEMEKLATVVWLHPSQIVNGDDWKSITILKKMGLI